MKLFLLQRIIIVSKSTWFILDNLKITLSCNFEIIFCAFVSLGDTDYCLSVLQHCLRLLKLFETNTNKINKLKQFLRFSEKNHVIHSNRFCNLRGHFMIIQCEQKYGSEFFHGTEMKSKSEKTCLPSRLADSVWAAKTIIQIEAKFSFARPIGASDSSLLQSAIRISSFKINFRPSSPW